MSMEKLLMQVALIDQVTKPLQGISKQMQSTMDAGRQGIANMATGGAGLVATGMAIQSALMPAIEMDRKVGEVKSLGVTDDALKQLQATALDFSVEYGKSAIDVVNSAYDIKSAFGDVNGNDLSDLTKSSAVLAAATKADASTITDYMGTMYGVFKKSADEAGLGIWSAQVAGMTAQSVEMFKTTGSGMSSAFTSVGADATSAGIAMEEQMAILGTLQATMSGSEAGTKYRAFLGGVANAQDKLNLSFTDSQGQMLPMLDILQELKGKYGDTIDVAESAELAKAFGTKEATGMIKLLMADTDGLAQSIETLGQVQGMSKAEEMAASMTDQWERLEAVWFAVRASVFGTILPSINAVVGSMVEGMSVLVAWVDEFPILGEILGYVAIAGLSFGGVVAGLSLAMGIGQMMSAGWALTMGGLSGMFKMLRISTMLMTASTWLFNAALWANPITWVVAVIGGLIVAIGAAIYYWDEIKASFGDTAIFKMLSDTIDWVIDKLNMIPGIDIDFNAGAMPETPEMQATKQAVDVSPMTEITKVEGGFSPALASNDDEFSQQAQVAQLPPMLSVVPHSETPEVEVAQQALVAQVPPMLSIVPQQTTAFASNNEDVPSVASYKQPQNQTPLPQSMVKNVTTVNKQQGGNVRQYGDIHITTQQAFTPDQLAEWDELNVG